MGERELPEGWEWKRLGDITKIQAGGTPRRGVRNYWTNGTIPWVKISDIREKYIETTSECITDSGLRDSSAKIFPKGTILLSIFATLGDIGILKIDATCNQAIAGIIVEDKNVDPDYLYYVLKDLKSHFERIGRGVAQNNINQSILKDTIIPLPPLPVQRHIVAVLEQAEAVMWQRQEADALMGVLLQSVFFGMFGDPERNERGWKKVKLGSIITKIDSGPSKKLNVAGKGFINITSGEIQKGLFLVFKNLKYLEVPDDLTRYFLEKDDLIINYVNSLSEIGKSALYRGEFSPVVVGHNVFRVRIDQSTVDPIFLVSFIKTLYFRNQIKTITKPAVNQASFSTKDLKKCEVLLPPLALQQQFAHIVEDVERIREQQVASGKEIEGLCEGLMARAFAGKLVA